MNASPLLGPTLPAPAPNPHDHQQFLLPCPRAKCLQRMHAEDCSLSQGTMQDLCETKSTLISLLLDTALSLSSSA